LGAQYLDDTYYDPLAAGQSDLAGRHAYSHVNSLCSAMQAYLTLGSEKHLRAAKNGFDFLQAQSYATGGWGPDEELRAPGSADVYNSLTKTHHSFETPCGSYAHFKLTRYLLRVTRESRYGDSMERVMYNTILGAKPLQADGRTFYYADMNFKGSKFFHDARWPCCSGTMPQIAADYNISTYLRDAQGIYVNLYIPSTVRWNHRGAQISLTQSGGYPLHSHVQFELITSRPSEFTITFRIPAWAEGATISVNGKREMSNCDGMFADLKRRWNSGDHIEIDLPMKLRTESLDDAHPNVVALLSGPLVLFPIGDVPAEIEAKHLLLAKKTFADTWVAETPSGPLKLLPFTSIQDERYSTYTVVR
jgi:DUF1680 family protein